MKQVLLLVALFFATQAASGQTAPEQSAADANAQQQAGSEPAYQQLHDIPPQLRMPQQPQAQGQDRKSTASERWRYDPAARRGDGGQGPSNESGIERASKPNSPCNVPYNGLLAEWRIAGVKETIEKFYYWALLTLCVSLTLATFYTSWLLHQREGRLQIAGGIIAQLWNAHVSARGEALEAIEVHNKLVAELNAEDEAEQERAARAAATSSVASESSCAGSATEDRSSEASLTERGGDNQGFSGLVFERTPKPAPTVSGDSDLDGQENDAVLLSAKAARFAMTNNEEGSEVSAMPERPSDAGETSSAPSDFHKAPAGTGAEDVEAIKLALQKASETLAVQAAQLATKDAQLSAKDDKISSQREVLKQLHSRIQNNHDARGGAN
jgi:hypothetical protein